MRSTVKGVKKSVHNIRKRLDCNKLERKRAPSHMKNQQRQVFTERRVERGHKMVLDTKNRLIITELTLKHSHEI